MIETSSETSPSLDQSFDEYLAFLVANGLQINPNLKPAFFKLRNGLTYSGLMTLCQLVGQNDLVVVPIHMVLTSNQAYNHPSLKSIFQDQFFHEDQELLDDRILITFLLFSLDHSESNQIFRKWATMAKYFSKNIDILSFWKPDDMEQFVDQSLKKARNLELINFENEWTHYKKVVEKHEELRCNEHINYENYKWLYIHVVSRCFGSFLNCAYFVPFCELFNHNCVDVSYCCYPTIQTMQIISSEESIQKTVNFKKQEISKPLCLQSINCDNVPEDDLSISSNYSEDYISEGDFDYLSINTVGILWGNKICYDLNPKSTKHLHQIIEKFYSFLDGFEWKGFTLIYLGQVIEKVKIIENQYLAGRKKVEWATDQIKNLHQQSSDYLKRIIVYFKSNGREYNMKNKHSKSVGLVNQIQSGKSKQSYGCFKMEMRKSSSFEKNSQVYFSYGHLSNRRLLVRYGFCLEENNHDYVWIKIPLGNYVRPYPDLIEIMQQKGLPLTYKIKVKSNIFISELIIFLKMTKWSRTHHNFQLLFQITDFDKEIDALHQAKHILLDYLHRYDLAGDDLTDTTLDYHSYFARVYNVNQKNILERQIKLIEYLIQKCLQCQETNKKLDRNSIGKNYWKYFSRYL